MFVPLNDTPFGNPETYLKLTRPAASLSYTVNGTFNFAPRNTVIIGEEFSLSSNVVTVLLSVKFFNLTVGGVSSVAIIVGVLST